MEVVILAGGFGTRLAEETEVRPKPMVEIGSRPILWHILKHYSHFGFNEFFIALGFKGEVIKRYFVDYCSLHGSMSIDVATGRVAREAPPDDWKVHLVETGLATTTGGRVKRLESRLNGDTFMATYGDGVSDINLASLAEFHREQGRLATVTAVRPPGRYGALVLAGHSVERFTEKPQAGEGWINGGFMVFERGVFDYLKHDQTSLEADTLHRLAADGELAAYRHGGFWQCMDTLRDKMMLQALWDSGTPPWKVWE
jgi:glucose-1-phosphate cytidylyltransferase